jgi:23S rRNA pseudouridine1911/1915/1917 synthase
MEKRFEFVVPEAGRRVRLEDYLLEAFPSISKMYLRELVRDQRCEVNGRIENIGYRLRPNDVIEIYVNETRGTAMIAEKMPLEILFEDLDLVVVNKPAGMLVHPSHREKRGTLMNGLAWHLNRHGRSVRPGLVHRLDKDTSGLMVVAKNARSHRILSSHFLKKRVAKNYQALVEGIVPDEDGTIESHIGRHADLKLWGVKPDGKHSVSKYHVVERYADTTLLDMEPVTGRTNQLRIHAAQIGNPIVGDTQRGGREAARLYLHAARLSFPHPSTRVVVTFECEAAFPPLI